MKHYSKQFWLYVASFLSLFLNVWTLETSVVSTAALVAAEGHWGWDGGGAQVQPSV